MIVAVAFYVLLIIWNLTMIAIGLYKEWQETQKEVEA